MADGLKVNLFASEKEGLTSPLAIRWDTAGRAYVTVTTTYPHVFPGDKIIVLEDSNGDSHQTSNSFVWSPGGELFMGQGDGIESRVETPWGSADLWQVPGTADAVESIAGESGAETAVRRAAFIAMARIGLDGADKTLNQLAAKPNTTPLAATMRS